MCLLLKEEKDEHAVLLLGSEIICRRVFVRYAVVLCNQECNNCASYLYRQRCCARESEFIATYQKLALQVEKETPNPEKIKIPMAHVACAEIRIA